jgi:hypothetical protein
VLLDSVVVFNIIVAVEGGAGVKEGFPLGILLLCLIETFIGVGNS